MEDNSSYTPESLIGVFNNTIAPMKNLIKVTGKFSKPKKLNAYNNKYYCELYDNISDYKLTICLDKSILDIMEEGYSYTVSGYLNKFIRKNVSIQLCLYVKNVVGSPSAILTKADKNKNVLIQNKIKQKHIDVRLVLESIIESKRKPKIALILGQNGIVHSDIYKALGKEISTYSIKEHRVNLSNYNLIKDKLFSLDKQNYDFIILTRGGGDLEVFNNYELGFEAYNLKTPLIVALGHAENGTLVDIMSDLSLTTPTSLGNYLKNISTNVNKYINAISIREEAIKSYRYKFVICLITIILLLFWKLI